MTTIILAAACFAVGAMLGSRYKVFVLIPANFIASGATVGVAAAESFAPWYTLAVAMLMIAILQVGFVAGAAALSIVTRMQEKDDAIVAAKTRQVHN